MRTAACGDVVEDGREVCRADDQHQIAELLVAVLVDDGAHHPEVLLSDTVVVAAPVRVLMRILSARDEACHTLGQLRGGLCVQNPVVFVEQILLVDEIHRSVMLEEQPRHVLACLALFLAVAARSPGKRALNPIGEHQQVAFRLDLPHAQLDVSRDLLDHLLREYLCVLLDRRDRVHVRNAGRNEDRQQRQQDERGNQSVANLNAAKQVL